MSQQRLVISGWSTASQFTICPLWANQPMRGWNITKPSPHHHHAQIIFHRNPQAADLKIGYSETARTRPGLSPAPAAVWLGSALLHLLFDELPDDPGHLVSVHLHHRLGHLDASVSICHWQDNKHTSVHCKKKSCRVKKKGVSASQTFVPHAAVKESL